MTYKKRLFSKIIKTPGCCMNKLTKAQQEKAWDALKKCDEVDGGIDEWGIVGYDPHDDWGDMVCNKDELTQAQQDNLDFFVMLIDQGDLLQDKWLIESDLENHDCHLSPEDSCDCLEAITKLREIDRRLEELRERMQDHA